MGRRRIKEKEEQDFFLNVVCEIHTNKKNPVAMKADNPHVFL